MELEQVSAVIRPRSDWEAVDLGFAMARRDFWWCWIGWWLAMVLPVGLVAFVAYDSPLLFLFLFWWLKPYGARIVLFILSRSLFGSVPSLWEVIKEIPRVYVRRFFLVMVWNRLSSWFSVMIAVDDLERVERNERIRRKLTLSRRGGNVVSLVFLVGEFAPAWLAPVWILVLKDVLSYGFMQQWTAAVESYDSSDPFMIPSLLMQVMVVSLMFSMSLVDVFSTGAGFGVYLNNRTWNEGWDVELAFKRMGKRLRKIGGLMVLGLGICWGGVQECQANPLRGNEDGGYYENVRNDIIVGGLSDEQVQQKIKAIKESPEFKVHKVIEKKPIEKKTTHVSWLESFFRWLGKAFPSGMFHGINGYRYAFYSCCIVLMLALVIWLGWRYRFVFCKYFQDREDGESKSSPVKVVMGMDVRVDHLPEDITGVVMKLWLDGQVREALSLLYRGAIAHMIHSARVTIMESDTEGDCLVRSEEVGGLAYPKYFKQLTRVWVQYAYAERLPTQGQVVQLCDEWPYGERRKA